jgi:hypothetical protein
MSAYDPTRTFSLRLHRYFPSELSCFDSLISTFPNSAACLVANFSMLKYFLHWCPIGFDPAAIVATIAVRRNSDLNELKARARLALF